MTLSLQDWPIEQMTGYQPITTLYMEFSLVEYFGKEAIIDYYHSTMEELKTNYKYLTELVMVVNWKHWEHYVNKNEELAKLYAELYRNGRHYALDNLEDEELTYYLETTD